MSKYGNRKSVASDGKVLDSKREARRYEELLLLERMGKIRDLKTQSVFVLIPPQYIGGKCVERQVTWRADFDYFDDAGVRHTEDAKGLRTQQYILRRKLLLWVHGIRIEEV